MEAVRITLTVFFDDPFWVAVFERQNGPALEAARVVLGAEPRDHEVYQLVLTTYVALRYSPAVGGTPPAPRAASPKRAQREASRAIQRQGVGTKAQEALKAQREQTKTERRTQSREAREADLARKYGLRQEKRRQKHLGH